ncbi:MAG: alpha/beta fold hydrolase [Bacteroidota bacterium]|nr:alpha/beta fold hydrolase [Bacteroidota bacterium]
MNRPSSVRQRLYQHRFNHRFTNVMTCFRSLAGFERQWLVMILLLACLPLSAQQLAGKWKGKLAVNQALSLRVGLTVSQVDSGYAATMDSPDQGAYGIPVDAVHFDGSVLKVTINKLSVIYEGTFTKDGELTGLFKQGSTQIPLVLTRDTAGEVNVSRPQEPKEPLPYKVEDVTFPNREAGITLAGTLTLPSEKGPYPVVVLISGSGPQNRNEELFGHKPFLVISDFLARNGIAALRVDDRGTGSSTGDFSTATTQDFAGDVNAAVNYLKGRKEINRKHIGLAGHSEGGLIAPMVASTRKGIDFIVLLAGPGLPGHNILLIQQQLIGKAMNMTDEQLEKTLATNTTLFDILLSGKEETSIKAQAKAFLMEELAKTPISQKPAGKPDEVTAEEVLKAYTTPWMLNFLKYDPAPVLKKVHCPVLVLNGSKDLQVSAVENLTAIKRALQDGGNDRVTIREYPNLNHLFQTCKTGLPAEYGIIQETISPQVLNDISNWIRMTVK